MTKQMNPSNSALWAIDPDETQLRPSNESLQSVKHFLGGSFQGVHPVYLYNDEDLTTTNALEKMNNFLLPLELGELSFSEALFSTARSNKERVGWILELAHLRACKMILLTSHGRSSLGAVVLGSFAKEIIQQSDLPVIVMTPQSQFQGGENTVLFATDLSDVSKKAFSEFLKFVRGRASKVILCHVLNLSLPSGNAAAAGGFAMTFPAYYIDEQKEWAAREVEQWLEQARGLDMDIVFQSIIEESMSRSSNALERIAAKEKVGLIGIVPHAGPIEAFVAGSVTQDLLESQKCNLWVCGPKFNVGT